MALVVAIENGFAGVGAGAWLAGRGQPAAYSGVLSRRRRKGLFVRDRSHLELVETTGYARFASSESPFLTHIPCAAPVSAVSAKVLVAPAAAHSGSFVLRPVPMSARSALCVSQFAQPAEDTPGGTPAEGAWVVAATAGRTARIALAEGETVAVRPESLVAWTGNRPTGFCRKITFLDILLPRAPRELMLTFYGPAVVWIEGAPGVRRAGLSRRERARRAYGV